MKEKTLHMIGNAHIDPVWLWQWPEGFHEVKATFRSALDRMKEYPDFIFISSSAAYYEWVEKSDPAMFAEIQQRVREGRWGLAGGWWIQPDCNLPAGESFVRQALYGQRYFMKKFDRTARVGYNVDSFGHNGMLPQLLKKSGLDYYLFMRPQPHEKGLPGNLFWWEADDGSRVLAGRIPFEYGSWGKGLEAHVQRCAGEIKAPFHSALCFYGVGNHGGGPTRENLESILNLDADPNTPNLVFSTPEDFFNQLVSTGVDLPVVHDDLQHHASGCYAVHSGIKRWNRRGENLLLTAEKFAAIAAWTVEQPYPVDFSQAWKDLLFNQFHDILAGTSLEAAYEDARDLYGEAAAIAGRGLNYALQALAWKIKVDPEEGMTPIVVFNPHAWGVNQNVEMEFHTLKEGEILLDDAGQPVPLQLLQSAASARGRCRMSFLANLPPMGYRTYRLVQANLHLEIQPEKHHSSPFTAGPDFLENEYFHLEFDTQTGAIRQLLDRRAGVNVFSGLAALPVVIDDPSDTWSHNVFQFSHVTDQFQACSLRVVACGPVKACLRVTSEYGQSRLVQDFTLFRDLPHIEVKVSIDWREQFKTLKLRFPLNLSHMRATSEIPYGHIERFANGQEEPGQSWLDLSGMSRDSGLPYGFSLLNDGKYSYDVNIREIGLTILRSPIYAHHIPFTPQSGEEYTFIDQGPQRFTYVLLPHSGGWETAGTVRRAAELNTLPLTLAGTYHPDGSLPQSASFVSVDQENIIVSVLKNAEEGADIILRAYETNQEAAHVTFCFTAWQRAFEADFGPCEIKTFRVPRDPSQPVVETNLIEIELS